ncbi:MAG: hypothetical protein H8E34_11100 [Bacteroidetes bacterium]|nr:hypothetical protein [Bacteroidota bacterium]
MILMDKKILNKLISGILIFLIIGFSDIAFSYEKESRITFEFNIGIPNFYSPSNNNLFDFIGFELSYDYGIFDYIWIGPYFSVVTGIGNEGVKENYPVSINGVDEKGSLFFDSDLSALGVHLKYVPPFLETETLTTRIIGGTGFSLLRFKNQSLLNNKGEKYDINIQNRSTINLFYTFGFETELSVYELFCIGSGIKIDILNDYIYSVRWVLPITLSYEWS